MDIYGATLKMAENLIVLKRAGSPWISRKGVYARPSAAALEGARSVLQYDGPGFWDCT